MQLSTRGRYAVMAMVDLASRQTVGCECGPVCLAEVAASQQLSLSYLEQLFARLRRAGLVASARGPGGGYRLARDSDRITIAAIIAAVDEPIRATRCDDKSGPCIALPGQLTERCQTHDLWAELGRQISCFSARSPWPTSCSAGARPRGPAHPRLRPGRGGVGMHYLDANASEPLRPEAKAAMTAAFEVTGNPSSVHAAGRASRRLVEDARERIAARFDARGQDVVFTSGGTESDALAVHALGLGRRIIRCATEHDAVRAATPDAAVLPVDRRGVADLDALRHWLAEGPPALVCLMLANNETGTIQPVAEAAALCRSAWRVAARRRGSGGRPYRGQPEHPWLRLPRAVLAQDGWSHRCRRAVAGTRTDRHRPADRRRRAGAWPSRRDATGRRHRRVSRRCATSVPIRAASPGYGIAPRPPRCTTARSCAAVAAQVERVWPIRRRWLCQVSGPMRRSSRWTSTGSRSAPAPPAVPARSRPAMC